MKEMKKIFELCLVQPLKLNAFINLLFFFFLCTFLPKWRNYIVNWESRDFFHYFFENLKIWESGLASAGGAKQLERAVLSCSGRNLRTKLTLVTSSRSCRGCRIVVSSVPRKTSAGQSGQELTESEEAHSAAWPQNKVGWASLSEIYYFFFYSKFSFSLQFFLNTVCVLPLILVLAFSCAKICNTTSSFKYWNLKA